MQHFAVQLIILNGHQNLKHIEFRGCVDYPLDNLPNTIQSISIYILKIHLMNLPITLKILMIHNNHNNSIIKPPYECITGTLEDILKQSKYTCAYNKTSFQLPNGLAFVES